MNPSLQNITSGAFWRQLLALANADAEFKTKAAHLDHLNMQLLIGEQRFDFHIDHGRITSGNDAAPAFVISGPPQEWARLIGGEIVYGQATNVAHGKLRVAGNAVAAAWATRAMWQLWRISAHAGIAGEKHA